MFKKSELFSLLVVLQHVLNVGPDQLPLLGHVETFAKARPLQILIVTSRRAYPRCHPHLASFRQRYSTSWCWCSSLH